MSCENIDVMNKWMNEWCIYLALLLCITVHPKRFTIMWGVSHPGTDQAQPCLASVGNQSWAVGWYGCGAVRELFMNILHVLFYLFVIVRNSLCGWEKTTANLLKSNCRCIYCAADNQIPSKNNRATNVHQGSTQKSVLCYWEAGHECDHATLLGQEHTKQSPVAILHLKPLLLERTGTLYG